MATFTQKEKDFLDRLIEDFEDEEDEDE